MEVCNNVDCGIVSGASGTCIGPNSGKCSYPLRQDCEAVGGCAWDANAGNCIVDSSFGCDVYNNKELCDKAACDWLPLGQ